MRRLQRAYGLSETGALMTASPPKSPSCDRTWEMGARAGVA